MVWPVIIGALAVAGLATLTKRAVNYFQVRAATRLHPDFKPLEWKFGTQEFKLNSFGKIENKWTGPFEAKMTVTEASQILGIDSYALNNRKLFS